MNKELLQQFRSPAFPGSFFLSFEGIEGAGKSTQIISAKEYLESQGFRVLILREPGGTPFGEKLRQAILNSKTELEPISEAYLFASSRAQLLTEVTLKELNVPGTIIIYDRYIDSSIAYQGIARGLGIETILGIHSTFPLNLMPHKTFYLKISLDTSFGRQRVRNSPKDYFESRGKDFYENLVTGFETSCELFPDRICVIDGNRGLDEVFESIKAEIDELIMKKDEQ
ncbi:dTMP kinase [Halobacteriovorax marinus]|uniref:Thymidylate kinase n=1 Tax=Halobacteriovorax marinus TaxID=97084 RepID=A0A1Y5F4P0_9BACT|nr:dTMP kinase [Halobacteriovorax marinus]